VDALGSTTRSITPPRALRDDGAWDRGGGCCGVRSGRWSFSRDDSREWATLRAPRATGRIVFCQSSSSSSSSRETVRGENFRGSWSDNVVWDGAVAVSTALSAMHVDCASVGTAPSRHGREEGCSRGAEARRNKHGVNGRGDAQQPALTMLRGRFVRSLQWDLQFATSAERAGRANTEKEELHWQLTHCSRVKSCMILLAAPRYPMPQCLDGACR
jgi:hypothetical protein